MSDGDAEEQIKRINENFVSESTRKAYNRYNKKFLEWISNNYDPKNLEGLIIDNKIQVQKLSLHIIQKFIVFIGKQKSRLGPGTYCNYRSAIMHLFREQNILPPQEFNSQLRTFFGGLKRIIVDEKQKGERRVSEGKDPISFQLYNTICKHFITNGDTFSLLYTILSWNLACRTNNTEGIQLGHISRGLDNIEVVMPKTKTNQEGDMPTDGKSIYANPKMPWICPIFALGIYFLCNPNFDINGGLFPGGNQSSRYSKHLNACLKKCKISSSIYGTHSLRKGAATFLTSGTTSGPSIVSVSLRTGWTMGNVMDRYLRFERAGDNYVGRILCGLPVNESSFAILPPLFTDDIDLNVLLSSLFPTLYVMEDIRPVLELCSASLIYHKSFLKSNFQNEHSIFKTSLFILDTHEWSSKVMCEEFVCGQVYATGIPPHVAMLRHLTSIESRVLSLPESVSTRINETLELNAAASGTVTRQFIEELIRSTFQNSSCATNIDEAPKLQNNLCTPFLWDSSFHLLPKNYKIPRIDAMSGWVIWNLGIPENRLPPFRKITSKDFQTAIAEKNLAVGMFCTP
jgi:hypothetical protein